MKFELWVSHRLPNLQRIIFHFLQRRIQKKFTVKTINYFYKKVQSFINGAFLRKQLTALAVNYTRKKTSLQMFDWLLNKYLLIARFYSTYPRKLLMKFFLTLSRWSPYHIETSPWICRGNQWTGFYMLGTSAMEELKISRGIFKTLPNIYGGDFLGKQLTIFLRCSITDV